MIIQYYGDYCFKICAKPGGRATEEVILWTEPPQKSSGLRAPQGVADIVLLAQSPKLHGQFDGLKGDFVVFETPGEYASHGLTLKGFPSFCDAEGGALRGRNTFYTLSVEDFNVCFLGALGHMLTPEQLDHLGPIEILFIPVGGVDTLSTALADELIHKIEPAIIIPMHYNAGPATQDFGDIGAFCNEIGNCPEQSIPKLNIKKKDLEGKSMEVVLLERS